MVRVGRVKLYLLDTDTPSNTADDRKITARLYEADRGCRLRQEILLGMGGVQLMRALGIRPSVYHMNEGHSAFLILERIRLLMQERGLSFAEAGELVRGSSLFTTHTPVDAGNERFGLERMEPYFLPYAQSIGLPWPEFVRMGRFEGSERNVFEMTVLALNYSFRGQRRERPARIRFPPYVAGRLEGRAQGGDPHPVRHQRRPCAVVYGGAHAGAAG